MDGVDWARYGVGRNPKCADCMVHCGFEPTAVNDAFANPLKAAWVSLRGPRFTGPMAPEPTVRYPLPVELATADEAGGDGGSRRVA